MQCNELFKKLKKMYLRRTRILEIKKYVSLLK